MALSAACLEELSSDLECDICTETFQDPRGLVCQHIFCLKCLEKLCGSLKVITCPICRKETLLSLDTGVAGLPKPITLNKLRDTLSDALLKSNVPSQERQKTNTTCDVCDVNEQKPATIFCQECLEKMCTDCFKGHQGIEGFENHEGTEIEHFPHCKIHLNNVCKQYCQDCQVFACTKCMLGPHKGHSFMKVSVVKEKWQQQLKTGLDGMKQRLASLSEVSQSTLSLSSKVRYNYNANMAALNSWSLNATNNIQEVDDQIVTELKGINREQTTALEQHRLALNENLSILDGQVTIVQSALSTDDPEEICQAYMCMDKTIVTAEELPAFVSPVLNLPKPDLSKVGIMSTGGVRKCSLDGDTKSDSSVAVASKDVSTQTCTPQVAATVVTREQTVEQPSRMVADLSDEKHAAEWESSRWEVNSANPFKMDKSVKRIIDLVCAPSENRIAVRVEERGEKAALVIFTLDGDLVNDIDLDYDDDDDDYETQTGIAFDTDRERIILGYYPRRLVLYSADGDYIDRHNVKGVYDINRIVYCCAIDSLAVTDVVHGEVHMISCSTYKRKRSFSIFTMANSDEPILEPVCIAFDNTHKRFAVSDKDNRSVTLYDINGSVLNKISHPIIGKPNAISFSPEGVLFGGTFDTEGIAAGVWAIRFGPKTREPTVHIIIDEGHCFKCNVTASVVDNNKLLVVSYQKKVFMVERLE